LQTTSHAYIFLGNDSKTTQNALVLAQRANCENTDLAPCGFCKTCNLIQNKTHPDVIEIYPDGASVKIEQIRNLILSLAEKPIEGKNKFYILHEADTMTIEAQNAFLKTLEEPIAQSTVILLSDNLKKLIPTVLSRCQIQDFSETQVKPTLDIDIRRKIADILFYTTSKDGFLSFSEYIKELSDMDGKVDELLEYIFSLYRDIMLAKTNSKAELINKDLKPIIDKFVPLLNVNTIVRLMDIVYKQLRIAKSRGNKNLIWYNLLIGLEEVYNWSQ